MVRIKYYEPIAYDDDVAIRIAAMHKDSFARMMMSLMSLSELVDVLR